MPKRRPSTAPPPTEIARTLRLATAGHSPGLVRFLLNLLTRREAGREMLMATLTQMPRARVRRLMSLAEPAGRFLMPAALAKHTA